MSLSADVRWVSSTYILGWEFDKQLGKSLIYKRNSKHPSIVPWGIPQVNVQVYDEKWHHWQHIFEYDCLGKKTAIRSHA